MIQLRRMTDEEFREYLERMVPDYAREHAKAGSLPEDEALERARHEVEELLPDGVHTGDQHIYVIEDEVDGTPVGILWFAGQDHGPQRTAFVYDIEIFAPFRRRGYARQALLLLEDRARELGLSSISLHVFGSNTAARQLYRGLGFEETNVMMRKPIVGESSSTR